MNHPNVPVHESRSRRAGFLPAFRLTVILAAVVLTAPFARADVSPLFNNQPRSDTPGTSSTDSPEIAAAQKKVADLQKQLHSLQDQLTNLNAQEPQDLGKNASADDQKRYRLAHGSWQQQVDKLQHQIHSVKAQLAVAEEKLRVLKAQAARSGS
jgi:peptidoglycan hydrolase CwlO-like protein